MTEATDRASTDAFPLTTAAEPVDRAKVERLKAAIEAGEYTIDEDLIADKLIAQGFPGALTESKLTKTEATDPEG